MLVRKSTAVWEGGLKNGKGIMKIGSGASQPHPARSLKNSRVNVPLSLPTRFVLRSAS